MKVFFSKLGESCLQQCLVLVLMYGFDILFCVFRVYIYTLA